MFVLYFFLTLDTGMFFYDLYSKKVQIRVQNNEKSLFPTEAKKKGPMMTYLPDMTSIIRQLTR